MDDTKIRDYSRTTRGLQSDLLISKFRITDPRDKYLTNALTNKLRLEDSKLRSGYIDTFHCSDTKIISGGKTKTTRCKRRWCRTCSKILTYQRYRDYKGPLGRLPDLQFVTLTIPSVSESSLSPSVREMIKQFRSIQKKLVKMKTPVVGMRKLEVKYNDITNVYNPHFHLLVSGSTTAHTLVTEWLRTHPEASRSAQDITSAEFSQKLFRYFDKSVTGDTSDIHAIDTIFRAVHGLHTIQALGISKEKSVYTPSNRAVEMKESIWKWNRSASDWVNEESGELLTGHTPETERKPASQPVTPVHRTPTENLIYRRYPQAIRQASPIPRRSPSQLTNGPP